MVDHELVVTIPTAVKCHALLTWLEDSYDVSIKFWISVEQHPSTGVDIWLYCTGSGDLFDRVPSNDRVLRSRILQADGGNIYRPLWYCLLTLDTLFSSIRMPRSLRPPI